jgi:hypothetical protein
MLAVLITLSPGRRNEFIDCQKAKVRIAVLPIMDVKTHWISTLELLECAFRLREFTREWLQNPNYAEYRCKGVYASVRLRKGLDSNCRITVAHVDLSESVCRFEW